THAKVLERAAICIETLAVGSVYSNQLRSEVQHLTELHFLLPDLFLGGLALSDVDHSAHKFNEIAGRAQNRMTYDVNVPDGAVRMHNAVVRLPLCLLLDSRLDYLPEAGLVVGMKPLKEVFGSGETILWVETQNAV